MGFFIEFKPTDEESFRAEIRAYETFQQTIKYYQQVMHSQMTNEFYLHYRIEMKFVFNGKMRREKLAETFSIKFQFG